MNDHLTDEQMGAALLSQADAPTATHLAGCEECRRELEGMRKALSEARAESLAQGERTPEYWRQQRLAIAARLSVDNDFETRPLAWATSFAVVALLAAFLVQGLPPLQRAVEQPSASAVADQDHELLLDVARFTRREVPRALEPASLIAQELHRAAEQKSDR
ncbi:MAG: hypothetical protein M1453_03540 [Acidobacteria bacterium]|nr:hypothetical protein [Acidobacteriota bacterium]MCL5287053.1 hypothetical protein [Acidobacteriota bacterium]